MTEAKSAQPLCPQCGNERDAPREDSIERILACGDPFHSQSAQPQLPPRPKYMRPRNFDPADFVFGYEETNKYMKALEAENESLKASLDEARSGCVAWECAVSSLEAHLQDRIVMKDESQPDIYLSILQSDVANVTRDTEQIREATWHRERLYAARAEKAEAERDRALEVIREYQKSHAHGTWGCPTCIKADALLSRETKEEA